MRTLIALATVLASFSAFANDLSQVPAVQVKAYEAFVMSHKTMKPVLFEAIGPIMDGSTEFSGTFENTPKKTTLSCGDKVKTKKQYYITIDKDGVITSQNLGYFNNGDCD